MSSALALLHWNHISSIIEIQMPQNEPENVARYADMFAALGTEPRLRIIRLLLSAHPVGMNVGEIQAELGIPGSTLSHHLDKLKNEELVTVERRGTFLRYLANTEALQEVLTFLYAECCTRTRAIDPDEMVQIVPGLADAKKQKS